MGNIDERGAPSSVVVVGAGTMGPGIALAFARAGSRVAVTARRQSSLDRARTQLDQSLAVMERHGIIEAGTGPALRARIKLALVAAVEMDVDLIIETIVEDAAAKRAVLGQLEEQARSDAVIVTNTSSLSLTVLSTSMARPENFAGLHWFNPPELVELVELVPCALTSETTVHRLRGWVQAIGKLSIVLSKEIEGFVANRLQYAIMREGYHLVQLGICTAADVDEVLRSCLGPRWSALGTYQAMDLAGLDVHREVARRLFPLLSCAERPPRLLDDLVEQGVVGVKSGGGLRGEYPQERIAELVERRTAVLAAMDDIKRARE